MKQLRALLFTALLLVSSLALNAQTTKYAAIIKALGQTELLDEDRRTQLATLLAQDSALSLPLELDLGAKLLAVSEHSLRLQTSPVGTAELRLLPARQRSGSAHDTHRDRQLSAGRCPHLFPQREWRSPSVYDTPSPSQLGGLPPRAPAPYEHRQRSPA